MALQWGVGRGMPWTLGRWTPNPSSLCFYNVPVSLHLYSLSCALLLISLPYLSRTYNGIIFKLIVAISVLNLRGQAACTQSSGEVLVSSAPGPTWDSRMLRWTHPFPGRCREQAHSRHWRRRGGGRGPSHFPLLQLFFFFTMPMYHIYKKHECFWYEWKIKLRLEWSN